MGHTHPHALEEKILWISSAVQETRVDRRGELTEEGRGDEDGGAEEGTPREGRGPYVHDTCWGEGSGKSDPFLRGGRE